MTRPAQLDDEDLLVVADLDPSIQPAARRLAAHVGLDGEMLIERHRVDMLIRDTEQAMECDNDC